MPTHFEYVCLPIGIHRFTWLNRSEDATIEFYNFIQQVYDTLPTEVTVVRILHDYQHLSFIPLVNVLPKVQLLKSQYPHLKRRVAYLSNDGHIEALIKSIETMADQTGSRQYFTPTDEHLAIAWLLED